MTTPRPTTLDALLRAYDTILLDAYGVLVDGRGARPGAAAVIDRLERTGHRYRICTNDASRLPEHVAERFSALGLSVPADRILTSGSLIAGHFQTHELRGRPTAVIGPEDSIAYVERAGGRIVGLEHAFEVLVICDERGVSFLEAANRAFSTACRQLDAGRPVELILPNPDLIYPDAGGGFGFTAGALALLIEQGLALRYPDHPNTRFTRLGKPQPALFREALRQTGHHHAVVIGDQLATDIAAARAAGLDAALIDGGVSAPGGAGDLPQPDWLLPAFGAGG